MTFLEKINILMSERGITQTQLAKELKIQQASISRWFTKQIQPHRSRLPKLAKYFGVTAKCLADDNSDIEYIKGKRFTSKETTPDSMQIILDKLEKIEKRLNKLESANKSKTQNKQSNGNLEVG